MGFPEGWSDANKYALLRALQENMTAFIYTEDERFAASLEAKLGKPTSEIVEAIRDFMQGLGFAMKSRSFHNEALFVNEEEFHPHKILHDTMLAQQENRAGGVWDPDELRNGLSKMRTYRHIFDGNPDLFFRRTQIWSKSGLEMRAKFYLWRELYLEEEQRASEIPMSDAKLERIRQLREIFTNVPPAPPPTPLTPTLMASPGLGGEETPAVQRGRPPKFSKVRPWTSEDIALFVDLVVQLTLDLQTKGESSLAAEIPEKLNRTSPSVMSKLLDIRNRLEAKKSPLRAATLPQVLYDPSSVSHKVFTSNWGDPEDPFALGFYAIKRFHNRFLSTAKKTRPAPRRMETRQHAEAVGSNDPSGQSTPTSRAKSQSAKQQIQPVVKPSMAHSSDSKPPRVPVAPPLQQVYSEFVRDCSTMLKKWSEAETYRVCVALLKVLPSHGSIPRAEFYERVAKEVDGASRQEMWLSGERILHLCQKRYGSLDCFAAAIEGSDAATPTRDEASDEKPLNDETVPGDNADDTPLASAPLLPSQTVSPARSPDRPVTNDSPLSPPSPEPLRTYSASGPVSTASYGKSNEAAMQILREKSSTKAHVETTPIESSPSTHHFSPDHYEFDYDPGTPDDEDEPEEEEKHDPAAQATPHEDDDDAEEEPESPAPRVTGTAGKIDPHDRDRHHRHRTDPYHHRHHYAESHSSRAPGHMHVSSSKTLVIQKTPAYCHCEDCVDRSRRRNRDHHTHAVSKSHGEAKEEMRSMSVHHKRRHQEVYAYAATDGHYVHEIAHKRIHYHGRDESEEEDEESDVGEDDMAAITGIWGKLMAPIQSDIQALEVKRREQLEREQDRVRDEQKRQWKQELQEQVRREWAPVPTAIGVEKTGPTNDDA